MIFHRIKKITPLEDLILRVEFQDGIIKDYDVKPLLKIIPAFEMLSYVPGLFKQVQVDVGGYGIIWNDELDLDCNELYFEGVTVKNKPSVN